MACTSKQEKQEEEIMIEQQATDATMVLLMEDQLRTPPLLNNLTGSYFVCKATKATAIISLKF